MPAHATAVERGSPCPFRILSTLLLGGFVMKASHSIALGRAVVLASLASFASAHTYIVDDDGPGADFTEISSAIAAASAGDVLLVQRGNYRAFTLDKGLSIVGYGPVITGHASIKDVPLHQIAVLAGLNVETLVVSGCSGTVVVRDLATQRVNVDRSRDVRMNDCHVEKPFSVASPPDEPLPGVAIAKARVELSNSFVRGTTYSPFISAGPTYKNGGTGIDLSSAGRLHATRCVVWGGDGSGPAHLNSPSGNGGDGGLVRTGATAIITGDGGQIWHGGYGGICLSCTHCLSDGSPGRALLVAGGLAYHSLTSFPTVTYTWGFHCNITVTGGGAGGTTLIPLDPPGPTMLAEGPMTAGSPLVFYVRAAPTSQGIFNIGLEPNVLPTPPILVEELVVPWRSVPFDLQNLWEVSISTIPPPTATPGMVFFAQALVQLPNGTLARTCSVPIVVR